jgi:N-acetylneuraminic acid mutarotase
VSLNEGNSGLIPLTFNVTRAGDTSSSSTVAWATQNGTAGEGDYAVASGTISFSAGQTSKSIVVNLKGDTKIEGDETFFVNLSGAAGATITDAQGQAKILNDDGTQPVSGISNITWTRNAPRSPEPRTESGVVQIGSKLYVFGGFTATGGTGQFFPLTRKVHVYDMVAKNWTQLTSIPNEAAGNHFGFATDGANIYIIAGQITDTYGQGTNTSWRYNIANNQWTQFVSLPQVRFGGISFIENGYLHFVGGDMADRETPTKDHWRINLADPSGGWQRRADLPQAGDHMSHAFVNGKHYVLGGEHGHHGLGPNDDNGYIQHNYNFAYDDATDTWATKANLPLALSHTEGQTLVINGQIVIIGGLLTGGDSNITDRVHVYDPVANSWKLLSTRFPKRVIGGVSGYLNGKIYHTNGYSPDETDRQVGFEGTVVLS